MATHIWSLNTESVGLSPRSLINLIGTWMYPNFGLMKVVSDKTRAEGHAFLEAYLNGGQHSQMGVRSSLSYYIHKNYIADFSPGLILYDSNFPDGFVGYSISSSIMLKIIYRLHCTY